MMKRIGIAILLAVCGILAAVALCRVNLEFTGKQPGGNDFFVLWRAGRALFHEHRNPYGEDVSREMQTAISGHPADPSTPGYSMAYPLYAEWFVLPLIWLDEYALARAIWMTVLELSCFALAVCAFILVGKKPGVVLAGGAALFSVSWYFAVRAIINGNIVILVGLCIACAWICAKNRLDVAAGVLLALSTVKPQVVLLPMLCLVIWTVRQHRYALIASMLGTIALLVFSAWLFQADWILENLRQIMRYPAWNRPGNPAEAGQILAGEAGYLAGWLLSGLSILLVGWTWIRLPRMELNGATAVFMLTLILAPWVGLTTDPGNQVVLGVPLFYAAATAGSEGGRGKVAGWLLLVVAWIGLWAVFLATIQRGEQPVQSPWLFFPLPAFLLGVWFSCPVLRSTVFGSMEHQS